MEDTVPPTRELQHGQATVPRVLLLELGDLSAEVCLLVVEVQVDPADREGHQGCQGLLHQGRILPPERIEK